MKARSEKSRMETGRPGGGKGRKEEVHGSGIYSASGPPARGSAKLKTVTSLGRVEPEAAGRSSRAALVGQPGPGSRKDAATAATPSTRSARHRAVAEQTTSYPRELARSEWQDYLADFSAEHEGWQAEIEVLQPDQTARIQARGLPFEGASLDWKAGECTTAVAAGDKKSDHLQHQLPRTTRLTALTENEFEVEAADRGRMLVRCREP